MIEGGLDQQPAHAEGVGPVLLGGGDHLGDAHLDAEVDHLVAVVGEDDVDQVLADVVDVALDRGQHDRALAALVGLLHVGLEVGDGRLHGLGRLEHEGQLHLAGGEEVAHRLHPGQQEVVDDGQGRVAGAPGPRRGRPPARCGRRRRSAVRAAARPASRGARSARRGRGRRPLEERRAARPGGRSRRGGGRRRGRGRPGGPPRRSARAAGSWRRGRWRASRPASTHSCRNTELRTWRAAGLRPNETLDRPRMVETPGSSALMRRMPSMVSMPSRRLSSMPVDRGRASGSKMRSAGSRP